MLLVSIAFLENYTNFKVVMDSKYISFILVGLLALTVGCGDNAREILEDSVPTLSHALKSGADPTRVSSVYTIDMLMLRNLFFGGYGEFPV